MEALCDPSILYRLMYFDNIWLEYIYRVNSKWWLCLAFYFSHLNKSLYAPLLSYPEDKTMCLLPPVRVKSFEQVLKANK